MASTAFRARDSASKKPFGVEKTQPRPASPRGSRPNRLSAEIFEAELTQVAAALEEGVAQRDLSRFYQALRATHLPAIAEFYTQDPRGLSRICFDILHRIGSISPAA